MDWFERLTSFAEGPYEETKGRLSVVEGRLRCIGTEHSHAVGTLTLPSLSDLRAEADKVAMPGRLRLSIVEATAGACTACLRTAARYSRVASQFNMLEMVGPRVTPEDGVTRYAFDRTQGPACAMAAGAATIYRSYLVPVAGGIGQTADRQLDGLADLGAALAEHLGPRKAPLWTMRNGYALATEEGLAAITVILHEADDAVCVDCCESACIPTSRSPTDQSQASSSARSSARPSR